MRFSGPKSDGRPLAMPEEFSGCAAKGPVSHDLRQVAMVFFIFLHFLHVFSPFRLLGTKGMLMRSMSHLSFARRI